MRPDETLLAIQQPPQLPELRLWLLRPDVDVEQRCDALTGDGHAPFWAFCWGSGQALARHVLERPCEVRGARVVDFGAGSAVVGIAAAMAGAREVIAVDTDPHAREYAERNAALNGVTIATASALPDRWDVLLAGDVLYEGHNLDAIEGLAAGGRRVLLADPGRPHNPRPSIAPIAQVSARTFPDVDYPICQTSIYRWGPPA